MASRTKISVVMATYNGERFLLDQLESIAVQSRKPDELIIVDDASKDATPRIIEEFAKNAPFSVVVKINPSNIGYARNFIRGTEYATGGIILFSDQDDLWHEDKVAMVEDYLTRSSDLLVTHDLEVVDEIGETIIDSFFEVARRLALPPCVLVHGCSIAFRRELLLTTGFPQKAPWCHDTWLTGLATALRMRGYIAKPLVKYRIHRNNASGWFLSQRPGFKSVLHRVSLPPFTKATEFDYFLSEHVYDKHIEDIRSKVEGLTGHLGKKEQAELLNSIRRRESIIAFLADRRYGQPLYRVAKSAVLFALLSYRSGGRFHGFLRDLLGRRRPFPASSLSGWPPS